MANNSAHQGGSFMSLNPLGLLAGPQGNVQQIAVSTAAPYEVRDALPIAPVTRLALNPGHNVPNSAARANRPGLGANVVLPMAQGIGSAPTPAQFPAANNVQGYGQPALVAAQPAQVVYPRQPKGWPFANAVGVVQGDVSTYPNYRATFPAHEVVNATPMDWKYLRNIIKPETRGITDEDTTRDFKQCRNRNAADAARPEVFRKRPTAQALRDVRSRVTGQTRALVEAHMEDIRTKNVASKRRQRVNERAMAEAAADDDEDDEADE